MNKKKFQIGTKNTHPRIQNFLYVHLKKPHVCCPSYISSLHSLHLNCEGPNASDSEIVIVVTGAVLQTTTLLNRNVYTCIMENKTFYFHSYSKILKI